MEYTTDTCTFEGETLVVECSGVQHTSDHRGPGFDFGPHLLQIASNVTKICRTLVKLILLVDIQPSVVQSLAMI